MLFDFKLVSLTEAARPKLKQQEEKKEEAQHKSQAFLEPVTRHDVDYGQQRLPNANSIVRQASNYLRNINTDEIKTVADLKRYIKQEKLAPRFPHIQWEDAEIVLEAVVLPSKLQSEAPEDTRDAQGCRVFEKVKRVLPTIPDEEESAVKVPVTMWIEKGNDPGIWLRKTPEFKESATQKKDSIRIRADRRKAHDDAARFSHWEYNEDQACYLETNYDASLAERNEYLETWKQRKPQYILVKTTPEFKEENEEKEDEKAEQLLPNAQGVSDIFNPPKAILSKAIQSHNAAVRFSYWEYDSEQDKYKLTEEGIKSKQYEKLLGLFDQTQPVDQKKSEEKICYETVQFSSNQGNIIAKPERQKKVRKKLTDDKVCLADVFDKESQRNWPVDLHITVPNKDLFTVKVIANVLDKSGCKHSRTFAYNIPEHCTVAQAKQLIFDHIPTQIKEQIDIKAVRLQNSNGEDFYNESLVRESVSHCGLTQFVLPCRLFPIKLDVVFIDVKGNRRKCSFFHPTVQGEGVSPRWITKDFKKYLLSTVLQRASGSEPLLQNPNREVRLLDFDDRNPRQQLGDLRVRDPSSRGFHTGMELYVKVSDAVFATPSAQAPSAPLVSEAEAKADRDFYASQDKYRVVKSPPIMPRSARPDDAPYLPFIPQAPYIQLKFRNAGNNVSHSVRVNPRHTTVRQVQEYIMKTNLFEDQKNRVPFSHIRFNWGSNSKSYGNDTERLLSHWGIDASEDKQTIDVRIASRDELNAEREQRLRKQAIEAISQKMLLTVSDLRGYKHTVAVSAYQPSITLLNEALARKLGADTLQQAFGEDYQFVAGSRNANRPLEDSADPCSYADLRAQRKVFAPNRQWKWGYRWFAGTPRRKQRTLLGLVLLALVTTLFSTLAWPALLFTGLAVFSALDCARENHWHDRSMRGKWVVASWVVTLVAIAALIAHTIAVPLFLSGMMGVPLFPLVPLFLLVVIVFVAVVRYALAGITPAYAKDPLLLLHDDGGNDDAFDRIVSSEDLSGSRRNTNEQVEVKREQHNPLVVEAHTAAGRKPSEESSLSFP